MSWLVIEGGNMLSSLMITAHCTGAQYFQNPIEDLYFSTGGF